MRSVRISVVCGIAGLVWAAGVANVSARTVQSGPAPHIQSVEGVDTFRAYCAVCHGVRAKGDGPASTALKTRPPDLTGIAKRHGKFSAIDVEATITGQEVMASHGSRAMPIWGPVFQSLASDNSFSKLRVANLVAYLKSIQAD